MQKRDPVTKLGAVMIDDEIIMKTHNSQSMFILKVHVNSIQDYRNETLAGGELRNSQNKKVR